MDIYQNQDSRLKTRFNFIRFTQMIICVSSTISVLHNFKYSSLKEVGIFALLLLISASYSLITTIDLLSRCVLLLAIPLKLWTIYALSATPMFFGSVLAYISIMQLHNGFWSILMLILHILAGFSFLWDGACIIFFRKYRITPIVEPPRKRLEIDDEIELGLEKDLNLEVIQHASSTSSYPSSPCEVSIHQNRRMLYKKPLATSYGGTFHVSKDSVPLPSPDIDHDCVLSTISEGSFRKKKKIRKVDHQGFRSS